MFSHKFLKNINSVDLILTPHSTWIKRFHQYFEQNQIDPLSKKPAVFLLSDWLIDRWSQHTGHRSQQLLTPTQSSALFHSIANTKASVSWHTAYLAYQAWCFYQVWDIDYTRFSSHPSFRFRQWQQWAATFDNLCSQNGYLDISHLIPILISHSFTISCLPQKIGLIGFDVHTAQERQLFHYLNLQNCSVEILNESNQNLCFSMGSLPSFYQTYSDLHALSNWAIKTAALSPNQKIICAISGLSTGRSTILRTFEHFTHLLSHPFDHQQPSYNIPLETASLINYAAIQIALLIIKLEPSKIAISELSMLLHSPYIEGADTERYARIQLDRLLRQHYCLTIKALDIITYAKSTNCLLFNDYLRRWQSSYVSTDRQRPSQWVHDFKTQLICWHWKANTQDESNQWSQLLNDFSSLDHILSPINRYQAIDLLTHLTILSKIPVQFQNSSTNIHLIDPKDIAYVSGDLFCGLIDRQSNSNIFGDNVFIESTLQKSLLPKFTHIPTHPTSYEKNICKRFKNDPELSLNNESDLLGLKKYIATLKHMSSSIAWEYFQDEFGPSVSDSQLTIGGTDLIRKQAMCPFRAFSDYRLTLKQQSLKLPQNIPSYAEKASCLHQILHSLWQHLGTQQDLKNMAQEQRSQLLANIIDTVVDNRGKKYPDLWRPQFRNIEKVRLHRLLKKWLQLELDRSYFTIHSLEKTVSYDIEGLHLRFSIDRIDQLEDGSLLIMDYKTNRQAPNTQYWMGEKPSDSQLPLYALSLSNNVSGIVWGHLRPEYGGRLIGLGKINCATIGPHFTQLSSIEWATSLNAWHIAIKALADQFYTGYAIVNPKEGDKSCTHCHYAALCRVKNC